MADLSKIKWYEYFNPLLWYAFIVGTIKAKLTAQPHVFEQYIYRMYAFDECRTCLKEGACTFCGCTTPDVMLVKSKVCAGGHWGAMKNKKDWEEFKKKFGIQFKVEFTK